MTCKCHTCRGEATIAEMLVALAIIIILAVVTASQVVYRHPTMGQKITQRESQPTWNTNANKRK